MWLSLVTRITIDWPKNGASQRREEASGRLQPGSKTQKQKQQTTSTTTTTATTTTITTNKFPVKKEEEEEEEEKKTTRNTNNETAAVEGVLGSTKFFFHLPIELHFAIENTSEDGTGLGIFFGNPIIIE